MINFRFHLVSLVAVFLALAVGVVMGYGVLGQPTVEGLQNRIDTVERNAEASRQENDDLRAEVDRQTEQLEAAGQFAVTGRLTDASVLVLAVRGLAEDVVTDTVQLARQAGADTPGVLWLEPKWALQTQEDRDALIDALGTSVTRRNALRERGWRSLTNRLVNGAGVEVDTLQALVDAGFIAYQGASEDESRSLDELGGPETLTLLVLGTDGAVTPDQVLAPFTRAAVEDGLLVAAAEVFVVADDGPARGELVAAVRSDEALASQVSTVDNLDRPAGRIVAVLALADLRRGVVGHYGSGDGATAVAPAWWQP